MKISHGVVPIVALMLCNCVSSGETESDSSADLSNALRIVSNDSSLCLDDRGAGTNNGNKIELWSCNHTAAQAWRYTQNGELVGPGGKCLDIRGDNQNWGTPVQLFQCNGTDAQKWTFDGTQIKNIQGLCLDVRGGAFEQGTQVQVWQCVVTPDQVWHVQGGSSAIDGGTTTDGATTTDGGSTPADAGTTPPTTPPSNMPACFAHTAPTAPTVAPGSGSWTYDLDAQHNGLGLVALNDAAYLVGTPSGVGTPYPFAVRDEQHRVVAYLTPASQSDGTYRYQLPTSCYGYFEIAPTAGNASSLIPGIGSRPAGLLTYAVMAPPDTNPTLDFVDDFASIQGGTSEPGENALSTVGFSWMGYTTVGIHYCQGTANDPYPAIFQSSKILPLFYMNCGYDPSGDLSATGPWGQYLDQVIPQLVKAYSFVPTRRYQLSWEPNAGQWSGTAAQLVQYYATAYAKIHEYDPHAIVMGTTIAGFGEWIGYFQAELDAGLAPYIDALSWHPYPVLSQIVDPAQNDAYIAQVRQMIASAKGRGIPFYGTESGISYYELAYLSSYTPGEPVPLNNYNTGVAINADNINVVHGSANTWEALQEKADGAVMHTYFYTADYSTQPGFGLAYNDTAAYTVGPSKISPKVDVPMVRTTNELLNHSDAVGSITAPNGTTSVRVLFFRQKRTNVNVAALYDTSGNNASYTLQTGAAHVTVGDAFGNTQTVATQNGALTLQLSFEPQYVFGLAASALTSITAAPPTNQ